MVTRIRDLYSIVLQYAVDRSKIYDDGWLEKIQDLTIKSKVLEKHKYSIWQGTGKDKRWKTTLADRRVVAKNTEQELFEYLADYYLIGKGVTVADLYPEWLEYKSYHTRSTNYLGRLDNDWRKYYKDTDIVNIPIKKLTKLMLDEWAHRLVRNYNLTNKQYYNLSTIMKQILEYAIDKEIIPTNPFLRVKIDCKLFRGMRKPLAASQVFSPEEIELLKAEAYDDFNATGDTGSLAIIILIMTGLRAGELVALRDTDLEDLYLNVERQEIKISQKNRDGSWSRCGYEVVDYTKSKAGTRKVFMPEEVRKVFGLIKKHNMKNGLTDPDHYLFFSRHGDRMHECSLDKKIYKFCDKLGIQRRSIHKLRKTFISTLLDNKVNSDTVRETVGHQDMRTTLNNYYYDRKTEKQIEEQMERIWASNQ